MTTRFRVTHRGTLHFDGRDVVFDGWGLDGDGRSFRDAFDMYTEARTAVLMEVALAAGVLLEPRCTDFTTITWPTGFAAERAAREAIEHARAPRRPWWRFWR